MLGIVAAAAVSFYVVSFAELGEVPLYLPFLVLSSLAVSFIWLDSCLIHSFCCNFLLYVVNLQNHLGI